MSTTKATQTNTRNRLMSAFESTGLLREVKEVELTMPNGKLVPNKKALLYADDDSYISTVGNRYSVIQNEVVMEKLSSALIESGLNLKGFSVGHSSSFTHARNLVTITLPQHQIETSKGDATSLQLLSRNSYDGSWKQQLDIGGFRMACANGQIWGDMITAYSNRHTSRQSVIEMAEYLSHAIDVFKEMGTQWLTMKKSKLTKAQAEDLILEYLGKRVLNKEDRERILTSERSLAVQSMLNSWAEYKEELGSNAFALYNTFTSYATHVGDMKSPADSQVIRGNRIAKIISPLIH